MIADFLIKFLSGCFIIIFSFWLFFKTLKDTINGFKSEFGNDIGLYGASLAGAILGGALIYKALSVFF